VLRENNEDLLVNCLEIEAVDDTFIANHADCKASSWHRKTHQAFGQVQGTLVTVLRILKQFVSKCVHSFQARATRHTSNSFHSRLKAIH